jgi:putative ABC transport system permease protein
MTSFSRGFALSGAGEPERVPGRLVSAGLFETLGAVPALGRSFATADEDVANAEVAVVSDGLWRRRFGADPSILGQRVTVDARPVTIVGVMPRGFGFPQGTDLWLPLAMRDPEMQVRRFHFLRIVGRVAPGSTFAAAQADLDAIAARLAEAHPDSNQGWRVRLEPLRQQLVGSFRVGPPPPLRRRGLRPADRLREHREPVPRPQRRAASRAGRCGRPGCVAVAALTPAPRGERYPGLRSAAPLACSSPSGSCSCCRSSVPAISSPSATSPWTARVLAFTALVSLVSGILFGIAPALQAARLSFHDALTSRGAGPSRQRARALLVAGELSLAAMLLMGAGLLLRSFTELLRVDAGFRARGVLTATVQLPEQRYGGPRAAAGLRRAARGGRARAARRQLGGGHVTPAHGPPGRRHLLHDRRATRARQRQAHRRHPGRDAGLF